MREFHFEIMVEFYFKILPYLAITITYVFFSLLFGFLLGALTAYFRLSKNRILNGIAGAYITVMRCVPSIVFLFLVYYGLPGLMRDHFGIDMNDVDAIVYVIITFSIMLGAYTSEIMRSAYLSVDHGQFEAAVLVGMDSLTAFRRIIFPQALHAAIPNIGNIIIFMFKEGALAYIIGLQDVLGRGYYLNSLKANAYSMETYLALTLIYWPLTLILEKTFRVLEKRHSIAFLIQKKSSGKEVQA